MTGKNRKFCYENHNLMSMKSRKQTLKTGVYQIFCLGIKKNDEIVTEKSEMSNWIYIEFYAV